MKELASVLEEIGCQNVRTYIQSGNAVFESDGADALQLSDSIRVGISRHRGFAPPALLLTLEQLNKAITNNPFPEATADPKSLHLGILACAPEKPDLETLESLRGKRERFRLVENIFYLHAPDGVGRSRLAANAERLLGVSMTDRNWRTVERLLKMARGSN